MVRLTAFDDGWGKKRFSTATTTVFIHLVAARRSRPFPCSAMSEDRGIRRRVERKRCGIPSGTYSSWDQLDAALLEAECGRCWEFQTGGEWPRWKRRSNNGTGGNRYLIRSDRAFNEGDALRRCSGQAKWLGLSAGRPSRMGSGRGRSPSSVGHFGLADDIGLTALCTGTRPHRFALARWLSVISRSTNHQKRMRTGFESSGHQNSGLPA